MESVLEQLRRREPVFHQAEFCGTRALLERSTAPEFWEVGASGNVYTREHVLDTVEARFRDGTEEDTSDWTITDFTVTPLSRDTQLVRYLLTQGDRRTRRASIWRRADVGWQIVYHQGTVVEAR